MHILIKNNLGFKFIYTTVSTNEWCACWQKTIQDFNPGTAYHCRNDRTNWLVKKILWRVQYGHHVKTVLFKYEVTVTGINSKQVIIRFLTKYKCKPGIPQFPQIIQFCMWVKLLSIRDSWCLNKKVKQICSVLTEVVYTRSTKP